MASGRFTKTVIDAESDFGNFIAYNNDTGKPNAVTLFANSLSTSSNQVVSVVVGVATTALAGISTLYTSTGVGVGTTVAGDLSNFSGWMYNEDMTTDGATPEVSQTGICGLWRLNCCINNAQCTGCCQISNTCSYFGAGTAQAVPGEFVSAAGTIYSRNDLNCTYTAANCCQKWGWPYCNICQCIGTCCYSATFSCCYVKATYGGTEITALHLGVGNTTMYMGWDHFCECGQCRAKCNCAMCYTGIMSATAFVGVLPGFMCGCCTSCCWSCTLQGPEMYLINHCHIGSCWDAKRMQIDPTGCPSNNFCKPWGAGSTPCCPYSSSCVPTTPNPVPYNCVCCKCCGCCCYHPGGKRCFMMLCQQLGKGQCNPNHPSQFGSFFMHNWYALMCPANWNNYCSEDTLSLATTAHVAQAWTPCCQSCCPSCNPGYWLRPIGCYNASLKWPGPAGVFSFSVGLRCDCCSYRWWGMCMCTCCNNVHAQGNQCHKTTCCGRMYFDFQHISICDGAGFRFCSSGACAESERRIWCRPCCCSYYCSNCGNGWECFMVNQSCGSISPYGVLSAMTCGAQIWLKHLTCCNAVYGIGGADYRCYCYCKCCCENCNWCNNNFVLHVVGVYDCPNTTWLAYGPDIQTYSCGDGGTNCCRFAGTELPIKYFTYHPGCDCHYFMVRTGPATASFCGGVHPGCGIFSVNMKCIRAYQQRRCICAGGACGSDTATIANCYFSCCTGTYSGHTSTAWIPLEPSGLNNHPSKDTLFAYTVPNAAGVGIASVLFCKLANFPEEWTCSYYTRPRMCVSCLFRYEHCAWSIGLYNCCTCGWDAFTTKDLVNWSSLPGTVVACTDPCIYCCLRAVPACIDRCCDCFTSNMECEGIIDQCIPINQYERTGVVLSAGDKIFVKNYGSSGAGKVSFQVWGYEG